MSMININSRINNNIVSDDNFFYRACLTNIILPKDNSQLVYIGASNIKNNIINGFMTPNWKCLFIDPIQIDNSEYKNHNIVIENFGISKKCEIREINNGDNKTSHEYVYLDKLLYKHNINDINILIIDAKKDAYDILRQINFHKYEFDIIYFNDIYMKDYEKSEIVMFMEHFGYFVYVYSNIVTVIRDKVDIEVEDIDEDISE